MSFEVTAIVEIPYGSMYKYEMDKNSGSLIVDRPLSRPLPYNYGYVPGTLHDDGDPLDICVLGQHPIHPTSKVKVRLLGAFKCTDNGFSDHKLLATVIGEAPAQELELAIDDVRHYLSHYKPGFVVESYVSAEEAYDILMKDVQAYQNA